MTNTRRVFLLPSYEKPTVTVAIARIVGRKQLACFLPEYGFEVKVEIETNVI